MKRFYTLVIAAMVAIGSYAANYQHSLGMVAGLGIGAQYKHMIYDDFTLIEEFGYFGCSSNAGYSGAINNLVLAYQGFAAEGRGILLDWYLGGQFKIGYAGPVAVGSGYSYSVSDGGVMGFGAAAGIEACMEDAPIAFSFDFRPGYAMTFTGSGVAAHLFDYSFNLAVRYRF